MMRKKVLLLLIIFSISFLFIENGHSLFVSYDLNGRDGAINSLVGINVSNYTPTRNIFSGYFYNGSFFGNASFVSQGNLNFSQIYRYRGRGGSTIEVRRIVKQPISISIEMLNISSCASFLPSNISCNGTGLFKVLNKKTMDIIRERIVQFSSNVLNGQTIDLYGENVADTLFHRTNVRVTKFNQGNVIFDNNATIGIFYSDGSGQLNFPSAPISNTTYANNTVVVKNIGTLNTTVYVCGNNFPGAVQFRVLYGSNFTNFVTLPICNSTLSFDGGIQITNRFSFLQNKWLHFYTARITYTSNFTQGTLNFRAAGA